jgi:hypothetical protein
LINANKLGMYVGVAAKRGKGRQHQSRTNRNSEKEAAARSHGYSSSNVRRFLRKNRIHSSGESPQRPFLARELLFPEEPANPILAAPAATLGALSAEIAPGSGILKVCSREMHASFTQI